MFTYFTPLTVNLTKNSKLEKFVHELNALWKLSGSSMGALRELVAVAGIGRRYTRQKALFPDLRLNGSIENWMTVS
jgi:hypothetical protein